VLLFGLVVACALRVQAQQQGAQEQQQEKQPDQPLDGAVLTKQKGCVYCHGEHLEGTEGKAPSLRSVGLRRDKTFIEGQIRNGGQSMPPFGEALTNDEIQTLVQYLSQMKEAPAKTNTDAKQRSGKKH
jgi:mono/diheme cytochrome c family protein